jgi:trigger factor
MKSTVTEISPTRRQINIEIGPEALKDAYGKVSQKYARAASVPGFRKGYAPLDVVRLRYKDEIKSEVLQQVIPPAVNDAINKHNLQPLAEPHLHLDSADDIRVNGSHPVSLNVEIEVMPEIPEPKYKDLEIMRRIRPVEDSDVEDLIADRLQQERALIPVDARPSEIGDTVIADLEGIFADDPKGEPIRADDLEVRLGDEVIERSFTENLVGVKEDDEKEFTVSYPADFTSSALAGRTVRYKAKIKSVGKMETPELNDEWAKSLDEGYTSVVDLRKKLRADLETLAKSEADARVRNSAIAKLIEENPFEVPNTLIESQARNLLSNFARDLAQRGVDLNAVQDELIKMTYTQMRTQAERDVRGAMLLEKIGELQKIDVADEEVQTEIRHLAEHHRTTPEDLRTDIEKRNGLATLRNNLKTRKAIEAVVANAKIVDEKWEDEVSVENKQHDKAEKPEKIKAKPEQKTKAAKKKTAK